MNSLIICSGTMWVELLDVSEKDIHKFRNAMERDRNNVWG